MLLTKKCAFLVGCALTFVQLVRRKVKIKLGANEKLCDLQCEGLFCIQSKDGYAFTTDAILLANFIGDAKNKTLVEFCAGSGVISMLVNVKQKPKIIYDVEIQERLSKMCARSLAFNGITNIIPVAQPLEIFAENFTEKADIVYANPPYYKIGSGRLPEKEEVKQAKYELSTNLDSIIKSAKKVLNSNGKIMLVYPTEREREVVLCLKANCFNVVRMQYVFPKKTKPSNIFLIEATFETVGEMDIMPDIIINNEDGSETEQLKRIYNRNNEFSIL